MNPRRDQMEEQTEAKCNQIQVPKMIRTYQHRITCSERATLGSESFHFSEREKMNPFIYPQNGNTRIKCP